MKTVNRQTLRTRPVFPIGTMMMLTELTARQIRYYEEQGLVTPKRTQTNRRLYSLDDVDRLLDIKEHLLEGLNIAAIKKIYLQKETKVLPPEQKMLTDEDVRRILYKELLNQREWRSKL